MMKTIQTLIKKSELKKLTKIPTLQNNNLTIKAGLNKSIIETLIKLKAKIVTIL